MNFIDTDGLVPQRSNGTGGGKNVFKPTPPNPFVIIFGYYSMLEGVSFVLTGIAMPIALAVNPETGGPLTLIMTLPAGGGMIVTGGMEIHDGYELVKGCTD